MCGIAGVPENVHRAENATRIKFAACSTVFFQPTVYLAHFFKHPTKPIPPAFDFFV